MKRFHPKYRNKEVYRVARKWSEESLLKDNSVFDKGKQLWTPELLDELHGKFVKKFNAGKSDSMKLDMAKLKRQLQGGSPECKQLMAECLWALYLFPHKMLNSNTKLQRMREAYSWSGEKLGEEHRLLDDKSLKGIAHAGIDFNKDHNHELAFLITAALAFKSKNIADRQQTLSDPWKFSRWLGATKNGQIRQFPHFLLHLLYPCKFEAVASKNKKIEILTGFGKAATKQLETTEIDKAMAHLRIEKEEEFGFDFNFFDENISGIWSK